MTESVGFIGLGVMGGGMARNIIAAGIDLVVTTSSPEKAAAFSKLGAAVVQTPAEMAQRVRLVITCVPDGRILRHVVGGSQGLTTQSWTGGLLVDCSTVGPSEEHAVGELLSKAGASLLDAPVSGGKKGAEAGTLTIMCGGAERDFARAGFVLQAIGSAIYHLGPLGAGQTTKACNQLVIAINLMGACEAIALARASGVDPRAMRDVLMTGAARSGVLDAHALRYLDGALEGGFRGELLAKDLGIAAGIGAQHRQVQPATTLAREMVQAACNAGFGGKDSAALGLLYDMLNGEAGAKETR